MRVMATRPPSSTPLTILGSSLKGWWDFSDASSLFQLSNGTTAVTADANPIGYATDKTTSGFHLLMATAGLRPLYKTAIQNGLSVARFDGVDDRMANASNFGAQPITIIGAIKIANTNNSAAWDGVGADRCAMFRGLSAGGALDVYSGTAVGAASTVAAFHVYETYHSGASSAIYVDGTQLATGNAGTQGLTAGFTLGDIAGGGAPNAIDAGEICVVGAALSAGQRSQMNAYFKSKWGTP